MTIRFGSWLPLIALAVLSLNMVTGVAHAEDDADPSSRVARLSYLKGDVYVQLSSQPGEDENASDADEWIEAQLNRPLTSGDSLSTDSRSRAELQFGDANLQAEEESRLHLLSLGDSRTQLQLDSGSINLFLLHDVDGQVEVITRNARVTLRDAGTYRLTAWDDDVTEVQVRDGQANVRGVNQTYPVRSGEQLTVRGVSRLSVQYDDVSRPDEFDRWAAQRNERSDRVAARRYVDEGVIGYEDLDDYGDWRYMNDYGYVWMPTHISTSWAPYRFGHWLWVAPWGWTWVDDAPWGFAPFHYGRWAEIDRRWCWIPGPRGVRAIYAPALVAWVGTPSISVSIGVGPNVGWFPLGPREIYRPIYRSSERYVRNINLANTHFSSNDFDRDFRRDPHDISYRNRSAVVVVPPQVLQRARPVQGNVLRTDPDKMTVTGRGPDIAIDRTSRWGEGRERTLPSRPVPNSRFSAPDAPFRMNRGEPVNPPRTPLYSPNESRPRIERRIPTPVTPPWPDVRTGRESSPNWNRPVTPETNRGNERNDNRGGQNNVDRERGQPRMAPPSVPPENPLRERRPISVEPMRPMEPPSAQPQPSAPSSDRENNRRRSHVGEAVNR